MTTLTSQSFSRPVNVLARTQGVTIQLHRVQFSEADWQAIRTAARRYGLPAPLIAAVLADERVRLDAHDHLQDVLLHAVASLPERLLPVLRRWVERLAGRPAETFSLGRAQMKFGTLRQLGELGYLEVPADFPGQLRLLLDPLMAPHLAAACLRATADRWAAAGVPILHRPEILGTLYSLGFEGRQGIHAHPQASERGQLIAVYAVYLRPREAGQKGGPPIIPAFNLPG
ncbi:hypothetical protein [Deinococcus sp. DB0503]|uniref:hypothetical protein n=1 Tax=Deinococcus sp. DB0503 TaxID=2479203 RepID=UPI0018DFE078|nr:hypothetical protein [Deinococcus sp. DB0503]MBI0447223.1 hypothetical protein [Deinococcus sp. DB0503]